MGDGFYLETMGCQMNVVDSEQIALLLGELGYTPRERPEDADLIVLNTCAIREKAERKVLGHLWQFKPLREANPRLIIAVGGCVAQQEGEKLLKEIPHLDIVFGTQNIHRLPELLRDAREKRQRRAETAFFDEAERLTRFPGRCATGAVSRYVTIMQGCDNFCAYCVVPYVRGREISRPAADVLAETRTLVAQGTREVTLIGQNVNSYGRKSEGEPSFAELLAMVHDIKGLERLRFVTSHPRDISPELVACFASLPKLCRHIHLPLQSGADAVLHSMGRGYTAARYLERVEQLRAACPELRLTTDVIVGFPGETESDFLETLEMVKRVRFADAYLFRYSPRPGTKAVTLPGAVPPEVQQERFDRLLAVQDAISREIWASDVGRTLPVLVEGESRQGSGQLFGRSTWGRVINFSGDAALIGRVVPVRITASYHNSQLGEPV